MVAFLVIMFVTMSLVLPAALTGQLLDEDWG